MHDDPTQAAQQKTNQTYQDALAHELGLPAPTPLTGMSTTPQAGMAQDIAETTVKPSGRDAKRHLSDIVSAYTHFAKGQVSEPNTEGSPYRHQTDTKPIPSPLPLKMKQNEMPFWRSL